MGGGVDGQELLGGWVLGRSGSSRIGERIGDDGERGCRPAVFQRDEKRKIDLFGQLRRGLAQVPASVPRGRVPCRAQAGMLLGAAGPRTDDLARTSIASVD